MRVIVRRICLLLLAVTLPVLDAGSVYAVGFESPPPVSNRQKAHIDVGFTGGGIGCSTDLADTASGSGSAVGKDFSLGKEPKERRVNLIQALRDEYGLTAAQAAGPVGNFMEESGGDHLPPDVNQGDTKGAPPNSSSLGYGWAQWSGSRKSAFATFLKNKGYLDAKGHATDAGDFAYMKKELAAGYKSTITELKKQKSPETAALSFHTTFEKSGDNMSQIKERADAARKAFNEYNGGGSDASGDSTEATDTSGACPEGGEAGDSVQSANFGNVVFPLKGSKKVVDNPGMFRNGDSDRGGHPYIAYDILVKPGVEVVAFADGEVTGTSSDRCGGKFLTIWNKEAKLGVTYMHLGSHIGMGKDVKAGQHVGVVGSAAAGCGTPHLHIDVATDKVRQGCSRNGCSIQDHFRSIGKDLFKAYQALPDN